jgi:hypothetical protein
VLSIVLIALAARGVLDPLTGALAQSAAVFAVVANSARVLQYGRVPDGGDADLSEPVSEEAIVAHGP